ncbi:MAG: hypothetical protein NVSMB60_07990 [Mycobacterium sp.]
MPIGTARQSWVDGIVYDYLSTQLRNPSVQAGRVLGFLGATDSTDSTGLAQSTLAASIGLTEETPETPVAAAAFTDSVTLLLPANALILAVLARVIVAIPTAATFSLGDAATPARFVAGVAVAAGTTAVGISQWSGAVTTLAAGPSQATAAAVRITPNLTPAAATGTVRLQAAYIQFVPPPA